MAAEIERSPLTDRPLNLPGQSVDFALRDFVDNHFVLPMFFVLTLCLISVWEWSAYAKNLPRQPWIVSTFAFGALAMAGVYWRYKWKNVLALRLGRDGERAVGQFLDTHVEADATVFHDVPCGHGNIDHVVICSRGIYAIETKTRSKPVGSRPLVVVEKDSLTVNGHAPDRDPLVQARVCADDLSRILKTSTGKAFTVRPVVVFPGWFIEDRRQPRSKEWVLEPKALPSWIEKESATLKGPDVCLATYHLSRYIRTHA